MTLGAAPARHVLFTAWRGTDLARGSHQGCEVRDGALVLTEPAGTLAYDDPYAGRRRPARYEWSAWLSPEVPHAFGATSLLPSWNVDTPDGCWVVVEVRAADESPEGRRWSPWFTLARWADTDAEIHATSLPGQAGDTAKVDTDVVEALNGTAWAASQVRLTLVRPVGSTARPRVRLVGLMASAVPCGAPAEVSPGGRAWGVELPVPAYSQQLHRDAFRRWDRGGRSWCSPTTTSMLLAFHDRLPPAEEYAWVDERVPQPFVVQAARRVFDHAYGGAGNWAFNAAYAGRPGTCAFVTRLRSLTEAESFLAAGLPLGATVSFPEEGLTGAGYATDGHLLTIVGFTADGDVICNDPASHGIARTDEVRVVYDRAEFERVWLGSAGGVVYVVHPDDVPLPAPDDPTEPNW
ncbi:MAG: peptidase C39 family protein [Nocardioidaceae bacterium]|nr:peptidase C39 family protein [Nocardioidaceae bacterium]NUS50776.1 peptidase C39 family protein [Nocardioidaceae bacterium]